VGDEVNVRRMPGTEVAHWKTREKDEIPEWWPASVLSF